MIATQRDVDLSAEERAKIRAASLAMPPFSDVERGLAKLKDAGFTLAVLTNSTLKSAKARLEQAGIDGYFEATLSADAVECYKPGAAAHKYAARELDVDLDEIRLVAAHAWDVEGAMRAGCKAAFIARPGKELNPKGSRPDIVGADLIRGADCYDTPRPRPLAPARMRAGHGHARSGRLSA